MKLYNYLRVMSAKERAAFAIAVGTTLAHLNNVKYGSRVASAALARSIAEHTGRSVAEWDLRPKDWHRIWPELAERSDAPIVVHPHQVVEGMKNVDFKRIDGCDQVMQVHRIAAAHARDE